TLGTAGVVRHRQVRVNVKATVEREADDFTRGIDGTCAGQIQGRTRGDERVQVDQLLALPQKRSRVETGVYRHADDLADVVNADGGAIHVPLERPEILHACFARPQEGMKAGVPLQ